MATSLERAFKRLGDTIIASIKNRKAPSVQNSQTVGGMTPEQIAALATKQSVGLGNLENFPVATQAVAEAGTSQAHLMTCFSVNQTFTKQTSIDNKVKGNVFTGFNANGSAGSTKLCYRMNICENEAEMNAVMNAKESFADVFDNWTRFSHNGTYNYPADPTELNVWRYDAALEQIICTKNSNTHIGFISAEAYDEFEFEAELSSKNGDDDRIGLCIAFAQVGGKQYTLTAVRQFDGWGGASNTFHVTYNMLHVGSKVLAQNDAGLGPINPYHTGQGTRKSGWVGVGWVRVKVKRTGDLIEAWTTLPKDGNYLEDKKITIDLNSNPLLAVFKGPQRFGYVCQSQLNATWKSLQRPGEYVPIFRLDDKSVRYWQNGQWTVQPADTYKTLLRHNRLYTNQVTKRLFAVSSPELIFPINKRT